MSDESTKNGLTTKDIIELVINAVIALAALVTAIKSQDNPKGGKGAKAPTTFGFQHIIIQSAMNKIKQATILTVVLLILAVAMNFSIEWKITVITAAVVDLVMIVRRVWESNNK